MGDSNRNGRRSGQGSEERRLLKKGKRGILNVIFGRTMLVVLTMALQIALLIFIFSSLQSMQSMLPIYYVLMILLYGAMILHLVNKNTEPTSKITWILLVVLAPPVGLALYSFVELDIGHRVLNRRLGELMEETAMLMPEPVELPERAALAAPELAGLSRYTWEHGRFPLYGNTDARYLSSGEASLEAMLEDLRAAKDFIFLEFFIIDEGYMWGRVLKVLEDKAREGVEVRVMYDGTCALFRLPYRYPEMLEKLGIRCKMFSPIRPVISAHYNNRDHRKILVIDGRVAYTGGVNLADEYVNRIERFGHWKDVSLRLEGAAVRSFTLMFLQMWNVNESGDRYAHYLDAPAGGPVAAPGWVLPYGDSPVDNERVGELVYTDILSRAQRYVHIMTPYLILDTEMLAALTFAAKRGVEVCILLPHIPDKRYAFALAKTHYAELLQAGVRIFEYTPGFVHAKTFVSDDCKAVVGTINLDYRSFYLHFECAAYLRDVPTVADVEADFQATVAQSQEIFIGDLKRIPLITRLAGWLLKVFAPVM
ncbi:MAG: cardiolipin synthase [Clostridia bacterium]|nr:cardiolipin synthase [Clostridia bacterium]MBR3273124.1 cardiolipin synthase [Clostridia bacterium]